MLMMGAACSGKRAAAVACIFTDLDLVWSYVREGVGRCHGQWILCSVINWSDLYKSQESNIRKASLNSGSRISFLCSSATCGGVNYLPWFSILSCFQAPCYITCKFFHAKWRILSYPFSLALTIWCTLVNVCGQKLQCDRSA